MCKEKFKTLSDCIKQLESCNFDDDKLHPLKNNVAFIQLKEAANNLDEIGKVVTPLKPQTGKINIPLIVEQAINTQEALIKELCGENVKNLYYSETHSVWIVEFWEGKPMSFVDFESTFIWLTTENSK